MSKKNTAGNAYGNWQKHMDKLIDKIDHRSKNGEDRENVDHVWEKHTINEEGSRVWSF